MDSNQGTEDSGMLFQIQQHSGRSLWCSRFLVTDTYDGFSIRTSSESCNRRVLEIVNDDAIRCFGNRWPVHIIPPICATGQIDFPKVRIIAFLTSMPIDDEMHLSSLIVVWFQILQFPIPDENVNEVLTTMDWDCLALDYET